jgi:hypothetical protein
LVATPQNPEIIRQLFVEAVAADVAAPVGIRSDCLGVKEPLPAWARQADSRYVVDENPLVDRLIRQLSVAPVITEWCEPRAGADLRSYYEKGVHDVVAYHVSMTASHNFAHRDAQVPMSPELFELWSRANVFAGYRYSVEGVAGSVAGTVASLQATWSNHGSAPATENWSVNYRLVDSSGNVVRTLESAVDLKTLFGGEPSATPPAAPVPAFVTEPLEIELADLIPGTYTLQAAATWQQHKPQASHVVNYPPMHLARDGRDQGGWYPIAQIDVR